MYVCMYVCTYLSYVIFANDSHIIIYIPIILCIYISSTNYLE